MIDSKKTVVFLSTYPPRECGIATFTQDLLQSSQKFLGSSILCKVAAFNLTPLDTYKYPGEVEWEVDQNDRKSYINLANTINNDPQITGVIIQHEYGIFGGVLGEKILSFMKHCHKPMLVTLHTVLPDPRMKMKEITEKIVRLASILVVLTHRSKEIVEEIYPASVGKVFVIPHGIHDSEFSTPEKYKEKLELNNHSILSTFGLLSRGKGIHYVLHALPEVIKKYPRVLYLILGETHPVVQRHEGEKYRNELIRLIAKLGLKKHVKFYDQYLSLNDLIEFLKATDIYIATSTNPDQAVSGTFSYALGTGRAVVSTEFAQAKEMITPETGRLVPIKNSSVLTTALLELLADEKKLQDMHQKAYAITRPMLWSNVAKQYENLLARTHIPALNLNHLHKMTDDFGLFQFAKFSEPHKEYGYTLDDNARALIVCSWLIRKGHTSELEELIGVYFRYLKNCQCPDGSFINYIDWEHKQPTLQNESELLEEAQSRAIWALSEVMSNRVISESIRNEAQKIFREILQKDWQPSFLRARAFTIKSFAIAIEHVPDKKKYLREKIIEHADFLISALKKNSHKSWHWFENNLAYNNALLSESLFIAAGITGDAEYLEKAIQSLDFLISKTFSSEIYLPIGHSHWYTHTKKRSTHDQQPEDPASMILALACAYENTHNEKYKNLAYKCFSWFLGNNTLGKPLINAATGGCYDGLEPYKVNENQGAESLISYLMANFIVRQF